MLRCLPATMQRICTTSQTAVYRTAWGKRSATKNSKACDLLMEHKPKETVCGIVGNIGREGEQMRVLSLEALRDTQVDMFTTVFIGNTQTKVLNGKMVTPRGYRDV